MSSTSPPLLAVAHGTRDPHGLATVESLLQRVQSQRPRLRVRLAYVDVVRPTLDEVLTGLSGEVVLVPLLLGAGYHVRVDIPRALSRAPSVRARVAAALGPDPLLVEALRERLEEAGSGDGGPIVLAAAGSTDLRSNADAAAVATLLADDTAREVRPAYACAGRPRVDEAIAGLAARGEGPVAVATYLLAPGHFAREVGRAGGHPTSRPLGAHQAVARLVLQRYDAALNA